MCGKEKVEKNIWATLEHANWRIRNNPDVQGIYNNLHIVVDIKRKRLEWLDI